MTGAKVIEKTFEINECLWGDNSREYPRAYFWIVPNSDRGTLAEHKDEFNKKVNDFFTVPFQNR
ncbi:MAG: hypothetical protein ABI863_22115 [Ginsengibacter sp.]